MFLPKFFVTPSKSRPCGTIRGVTLTELMVALSLLGLIMVLVLPQVINSANSSHLNSMARDSMTVVSGAFADFEGDQAPASNTTLLDLYPYLSYSKNFHGQSDVTIDPPPQGTGVTAFNCSSTVCSVTSASTTADAVQLKSGAVVVFPRSLSFSATNGNYALPFLVDPDGKATGNKDSVEFWLYVDGTIKSLATMTSSTINSAGTFNPTTNGDPTYLGF
jgi:prepilin-type N-terminal cleavage/methylation domain-containing protein